MGEADRPQRIIEAPANGPRRPLQMQTQAAVTNLMGGGQRQIRSHAHHNTLTST